MATTFFQFFVESNHLVRKAVGYSGNLNSMPSSVTLPTPSFISIFPHMSKPPYERNPDFMGITANMIFEKIYLIVLRTT